MLLIATALVLHTAAARRSAANARRLASDAANARDAGDSGKTQAGPLSAPSSRQSLDGADHDAALDKRLRSLFAVANILDRTRTLLALMKDFTADDFRIALDACPPGVGGRLNLEFERIFDEWSDRDPQAAVAYTRRNEDLATLPLRNWTASDPDAALRWVRDQAATDPEGKLLGAFISCVAGSDPGLAFEQLRDVSPQTRDATLARILRDRDPVSRDAMIRWLDSLEDPAEHAAAARTIFSNWPYTEALEQKFALLKRNPELLGDQPAEGIFSQWQKADPSAAREAFEQLPPGQIRRNALQEMISQVLEGGDAEAASEMMTCYPQDVDDALLATALSRSHYPHPGWNLEHTDLIQDPAVRDDLQAGLLYSWQQDEPDAAREWMSRHELSPRTREKLQQYSAASESEEQDETETEQAKAVGR